MRLPIIFGLPLLAAFVFACGGAAEAPVEGSETEIVTEPSLTLEDGTVPPLFKVDTGRTMNVAAGQGVGIFVEYATGGQWHLFWSCDSGLTSNACEMDIRILAEDGVLAEIAADGFASSDALDTTTSGALRATSTLKTEVEGLRFKTTPGGTVTLGARVRGLQLPDFLFFVENGTVKGGASTSFTNPVRLAGSKP